VVHIERVPLHTSYGALAGRVATIARMATVVHGSAGQTH
jgi:hypothetical protein